ncbi:VCBS repeat-containing protein [Dokdonella sp.]|uniref:FG-GAP repeat domain-containing protein n=1 Tax=Dokdonella sp. TaxID=2291710 RepID=UPI0025BD978F|nr:VCBS repeat-containing protein [Dokdonella sp.]MBX3689501.1 VCBS repeat-containing protein [Dokdonella sp.]
MPARLGSPMLLCALLSAPSLVCAQLAAPQLKWAYGGCFTSWCQTGWYSSPLAVAVDGQMAVAAASYDLVLLDGATGSLKWRAASDGRAWPGVALGDLAGNGQLALVVGRSGGQVTAYNLDGSVRSGWPVTAFTSGEVRSLALADLDGNGQLQVIVGSAASISTRQVNVLAANGSVRAGWPARRNGEPGYGAGMYNENLAIADLDGVDGPEIYAPNDTHYVTALDRDGNQIRAHSMFGTSSGGGNKTWAEVGVNVDEAADLRGWTMCASERRPNFASSAPAIARLFGANVLVQPGNVYNCDTDPYTDLYYDLWLLRGDRTRWSGNGHDWSVIPLQAASGAPLSQDYNVIENIAANAVVADLDGDGTSEFLLPSYDGKLHAWWLDKSEHGQWPFVIPGAGIHFASEPVVADLDNDGQAEVLFTSWGEKSRAEPGKLFVLSAIGTQLFAVDLPVARGGGWSGGLAAPTLANIDDDADLEILVNTAHAGVVAFDLPGTHSARTLWPTGRGSYLRAGVAAAANGGDRIFDDGFE